MLRTTEVPGNKRMCRAPCRRLVQEEASAHAQNALFHKVFKYNLHKRGASVFTSSSNKGTPELRVGDAFT